MSTFNFGDYTASFIIDGVLEIRPGVHTTALNRRGAIALAEWIFSQTGYDYPYTKIGCSWVAYVSYGNLCFAEQLKEKIVTMAVIRSVKKARLLLSWLYRFDEDNPYKRPSTKFGVNPKNENLFFIWYDKRQQFVLESENGIIESLEFSHVAAIIRVLEKFIVSERRCDL